MQGQFWGGSREGSGVRVGSVLDLLLRGDLGQ